MRAIILSLSFVLAIAGCGRSPLEACINDQMNAWAADNKRHQAWLEKDEADRQKNPASQEGTVMIGGVEVPKNLLGADPLGTPPSEESARATANLKCGRVYGSS